MSVEKVLFSIIIPTHNRSHVISRALDSVIAQKKSYWEIIVVDNCSTDNTKEIIDSYIKYDKRISYYFINQRGVSIARNFGITKAAGSYICFLDDDDEYYDNYLSILYEAINKNNNLPALYRTFAIDNYGSYSIKHKIKCNNESENKLHYLLDNVVYVNNVCLHSSILQHFKFDETLKVVEDYHLWLRVVANYPLICIPAHTSICYKSADTASAGSISTYKEYIVSYKRVFSDFNIKNNSNKSYLNRAVANNYLWLMTAYAAERNMYCTIISYLNHIKWSRSFKGFKTFLSHFKNTLIK